MKKNKVVTLNADDLICGNCNFCITDDGEPYCIMKDLYTHVELSQKCDEKDIRGRLMFAKKIEGL